MPVNLRQNEYVTAVAGVVALTVACWFLTPLTGYTGIALVYLLAVLLAGMMLKRGPVLLAAALSALSWNFMFIPPRFTFHIAKLEDTLMFATYFIVALTVGGLTAQLKAREQLAAQLQLAEQSERLRKSLLDCVSHELKTPVAAISAASEALVTSALQSNDAHLARQLASEIQDGSQRLNRVVNNLLDMTRLENGVIEPKLEWCDVGDLLQSALEMERDSTAGRKVSLDVPAGLPLVLVDHALVEQAAGKLIANAGRYSKETLELAARCHDGILTIAVSDDGPGLPMGDEERLFEKFYRADSTRTGGLGLGLSIAGGFIEALDGEVTAGNRVGGGARFTIVLPVQTADPKSMGSG